MFLPIKMLEQKIELVCFLLLFFFMVKHYCNAIKLTKLQIFKCKESEQTIKKGIKYGSQIRVDKVHNERLGWK